jgi:hypothetical protein
MDALALLALLGLLRCIADPDPLRYYFCALVIPLALWETFTLERPPVVSVLTAAALALLGTGSVPISIGVAEPKMTLWILSMAWTVTLGAYLAYRSFHPVVRRGEGSRVASSMSWRFPRTAVDSSAWSRGR